MYSAAWELLVNKCTIVGQLQLLRNLANFRLKSNNKVISKGLFWTILNIIVVVNNTKIYHICIFCLVFFGLFAMKHSLLDLHISIFLTNEVTLSQSKIDIHF
jgi:uncharacterized membrane protein